MNYHKKLDCEIVNICPRRLLLEVRSPNTPSFPRAAGELPGRVSGYLDCSPQNSIVISLNFEIRYAFL